MSSPWIDYRYGSCQIPAKEFLCGDILRLSKNREGPFMLAVVERLEPPTGKAAPGRVWARLPVPFCHAWAEDGGRPGCATGMAMLHWRFEEVCLWADEWKHELVGRLKCYPWPAAKDIDPEIQKLMDEEKTFGDRWSNAEGRATLRGYYIAQREHQSKEKP